MRGILKSALERHRESLGPPVIDGERHLRREQASWDGGNKMFPSWKPGHLYLCPTRLLFYQGSNKSWELPAEAVLGVEIVERRWVSRKTCPQLAVRRATEQGESTIHLRVDGLEVWRDRLRAIIRPKGDATPQPRGRRTPPKVGPLVTRAPPRKGLAK